MITIDSNLLVYAYNAAVKEHEPAKAWLSETLSGNERVGLAWSSIHAFLRLTTNDRIFDPAFTIVQSTGVVDSWLRRANVTILKPGPRYWSIFQQTLADSKARRDLVIDAHLGALAIEHDATVYTADSDFKRFAGVRVINPLR